MTLLEQTFSIDLIPQIYFFDVCPRVHHRSQLSFLTYKCMERIFDSFQIYSLQFPFNHWDSGDQE